MTARVKARQVPAQAVSSAVIDEVHADAGAANLSTEQSLALFTIPAGRLAAGDRLRCLASGEVFNNSGGTLTYTFRWKLGGNTALSLVFSLSTSASHRIFQFEPVVTVVSASAQRWGGFASVGGAGAGAGTPSTSALNAPVYTTSAEDTSTAKTFELTCQISAADAAASVTLHSASLILAKK